MGGYHTWALLDTGSTNTFVSRKLVNDLKLKGKSISYHLSTLWHRGSVGSELAAINIATPDAQSFALKNVLVTPEIPAKNDVKEYSYLCNLPLQQLGSDAQADVLIGLDNAYLLKPIDVRLEGNSNFLYAVQTLLGWSLAGPVNNSHINHVTANCANVDSQFHQLWDLESHDEDVLSMSQQDKSVLELWDREIYQSELGHYVLPVPWKNVRPNLPNNKFLAKKRLDNLLPRLQRSNIFEKYGQGIETLLTQGFAEALPSSELSLADGSVWYLPNHPVISASKPGNVRIVFDCADKLNNVSLNNQCLQGPDINNKLLHALLRFRQYEHAVMVDVKNMYLQVKIPPQDRNALRFLWTDEDHVKEYRMSSHLFGGIWCASSSTYALRKTTHDNECRELIKRTINKDMYVDDLLKYVPSFNEGVEVVKGCKQVLVSGRFNLTSFVTNNDDLLRLIPVDDRANEVKEIKYDIHTKALGIKCDTVNDAFYYHNAHLDDKNSVTKRLMLSQLFSMYDPLGLIALIAQHGVCPPV